MFFPIPRLQHQPPRAILAVQPGLFLLQHAEGLAGEVWPVDICRVEDVAQLVAGQAVELGDPRIQLGADQGAALVVPLLMTTRKDDCVFSPKCQAQQSVK